MNRFAPLRLLFLPTRRLRNSEHVFRAALISLFALTLALAATSSAQTFKVLQNVGAYNPLIQGLDGNLYGQANATKGKFGNGGSLFKMTPAGKLTTIYTFCNLANCADGLEPNGPVLGTDGNFYGTTHEGGANSSINCSGETSIACGTVFKITPSGTLTTIYNFCAKTNCTDGSLPVGDLIQGTDGNFYGMTGNGGNSPLCPNNGTQPLGCGTIFKITSSGTLTTLYSFCQSDTCPDGASPSGLLQGRDGNFYGTTNYGGTGFGGPQCNFLECGTIFKLTARGAFTSLYSFCIVSGCPDGAHPQTGFVQAASGVFYGTAGNGGSANDGTVFSFTTSNILTTLYNFCTQTGCPDGASPGGLTLGSDSNFYGVAFSFGANSGGTLFKITPAGSLTTLYSFCAQTDCDDGALPSAPLFQSTNGTFYGVTQGGGTTAGGVVFSLATGLRKFIDTIPTSGKVGSSVTILGNNLTGATSVTFNGTAATFTVVSGTEITATVPTGATSGKVKVVTPLATLSTNGSFRIP